VLVPVIGAEIAATWKVISEPGKVRGLDHEEAGFAWSRLLLF
jgi:hypothetical protein